MELNGVQLHVQTHPALFSPNAPDAGTLAMLSCVQLSPEDKLLDLGCGYGIVGIWAAKQIGAQRVTMVDMDALAVTLAAENAERNGVAGVRIVQSDGFRNLDGSGFSAILSNPPYHSDFSVAKHFIEKGFNRLAPGGTMYMVTKRRDWYKNKFISIFGGVLIQEINGYFVFIAEKRSADYAKRRR